MSDSLERSYIKREVPFFQVDNEIFDLALPLNIYQKIVYIYLCRCSNQGAQAFPSYLTISKKCGMSRRKAIDTINELIELNLLQKEVRPKNNKENLSNIYILNEPSACGAPPSAQDALSPSAQDAPPSAQDAPKKELYIKNNNIKKNTSGKSETSSKSKGNFNNFPQRTYDFEKLEKGLLGWDQDNIDT